MAEFKSVEDRLRHNVYLGSLRWDSQETTALQNEAADEIERLRGLVFANISAPLYDYVIVPIVPTSSMVVDGFEAVSEFQNSDEYEEMSGCQGAAESARICWKTMLNAIQKEYPVK